MRPKDEIIKEAKAHIKEYEAITNGNQAARTCLRNAYNMWYCLKELVEMDENKSNKP